MTRKHAISLFFVISTILMSGEQATGLPAVFDARDDARFIDMGVRTLSIDYIWVKDNAVTRSGSDYPNARLWLIMYEPEPYENVELMQEDRWNRSHEIARYELPGPTGDELWANGDEVAFRNLGVYDWRTHEFDRVVFRIIVEEPSSNIATDTIMWGTVHEDDSYSTMEYANDSISVFFRTVDLPEIFLTPMTSIEEVWLEHNVKSGGYEGLEIHVRFEIDHMRSFMGRLAVYLHYASDGTPVECHVADPLYRTPAGNLTIQQNFVPYYTDTIFTDFALFIPYDAFPVSSDFVDYFANIEIMDEERKVIGSTTSPVFSVRRPE